MSELKTKRNKASVQKFLNTIKDGAQKKDCLTIDQILSEATGEKASMWGASIVGYGSYRYRYASGREGDWMKIGFSPRKQNTTLYIMDGLDNYKDLLSKLGPHSTAKSCLYIKHLNDVDIEVLKQLIKLSLKKADFIGKV